MTIVIGGKTQQNNFPSFPDFYDDFKNKLLTYFLRGMGWTFQTQFKFPQKKR
jgi:hypothetical protein